MQFRTREAQRQTQFSLFSAVFARSTSATDTMFDTAPLPKEMRALNWILETTVHRAVKLSSSLKNTNQFVGVQTMLARDEVRRTTYAIAIENDGLRLFALKNGALSSSITVASGDVRRAHISLRKFDGAPIVAYVIKKNDGYVVQVNGKTITDVSSDFDFPFVTVKQPPIGYPALAQPEAIIVSYKDRSSNRIIIQRLHPVTLAPEVPTALDAIEPLGGADIAIGPTKTLLRYNSLDNGRIVTILRWSDDFGRTFAPPATVDLSSVPHDDQVPSNAPLCLDYTNRFHVPIAVRKGDTTTLLDIHPEDDLATAALSSGPSVNFSDVNFPKMPDRTMGFREGFGDGVTDGNGMIASVLVNGKLLVANSQSGGYSYPEAAHLNYDMQAMHCFRSTECYTRGGSANVVSMDYAFVEADGDGHALSSDLWIDTWDMPLPTPVLRAQWEQDTLRVIIDRDGWFFPGQTTFELEPAITEISKATFVGFREFALQFVDPSKLQDVTLTYETRNVFFHYKAAVQLVRP
jgi:hypothetical protein